MDLEGLELLKKMAADKAAEFVEDGMLVGLGTGSTAKYVVENLGEKVKNGELNITATPTSVATKKLASSYGVKMVPLEAIQTGEIDLVIDGADQVDVVSGICIKGGGGAHYWEKMVAEKSKKMIVIVDESKVVQNFNGFKVPVEVAVDQKEAVAELIDIEYREVMSDYGNAIGDVPFSGEISIEQFEEFLMSIEGIIETGIFISLVDYVIVASAEGVKVFEIDYQ